ncbi:GNAT family N-acetyltransferase [Sphingomonas sp.]|uniref:GNAT family N-acetyltransferase n=1 Tax=Sphingomonas sp. TaxID=28214 RepID=UPI0025CB8D1C|nr:GNAT family N-acetyltransferase [Sphingomonas sp.]MBV9527648.1 GNAT family N-acetyltransferase [Sphingomonas sp.]
MAETVAETARLRLRAWDGEDEARFYAVMNRPQVMTHLGGVQSPEEWSAAFNRLRGFQRDFGHTFWIVEDRKNGEILGFCGLKRVNAPGAGGLTGAHEIGWRLRPEAWGKGIAKEAAITSLDLAFSRFAAPFVIALTVEGNGPSWGLMTRLGMTRRSDLDFIDERFGPELNPCIVYRLDAGDWPAARAATIA